jgi:hypothetical protein
MIYLFTFNLGGQTASSVEVSIRPEGHRVYRNAPGTEFRRPNASQRTVIACHKVPIQSLSLFASITTTWRSFVPCATAAIP